MFDATITLFNRYHTKTGDVWYPHVLTNVNLIKDKAGLIKSYGAEQNDSVKIIINVQKDVDGITINNQKYYSPKEWAAQTNDKLPDTITFNDDPSYFDFFVEGDIGITAPVVDDTYVRGFYNDCNTKYDYCYAITKVGGLYTVIPHFEIYGN